MAISIAFLPLFYATPAKADTLQDAQAALVAGQQELQAATLDKFDADALVASASQDVIDATSNLAAAQTAYNSSKIDHPAVTTTGNAQNVVQNGTFDDASAWSNIVMYQDSMYNNSSTAVVRAGALWGSYSSGNFYYQQGLFPSPVRTVTFAVDVWDNANQRNNTQYDYYRIEFRTYSANGTRLNYYNLEYSGAWHDWMTRTATYQLSADAVRWDVGFRLADGGYWNGNYGPAVDNVRVIAATSTTTPAYSTYGQAETAALNAASLALATANSNYAQALAIQNQASVRLQSATASIPGLQLAVADAQAAIDAENARILAEQQAAAQAEADRIAAQQAAQAIIDAQIAANAETARLAAEAQAAAELAAQQAASAQAEADRLAAEQAAQAAAAAQAAEEARLAAQAAANATPPWWAQQNWEGEQVTITAPAGWVFYSVRAWYGSPTDSNCGADVSSILSEIMVGEHSVSLNLDNGTFGDPCGGVVKVTRFTWSVVPAPQIVVVDPVPVVDPTPTPSPSPTETPVIIVPIPVPTVEPTKEPVVVPTTEPTVAPTPTTTPTQEPTPTPTQTKEPTPEPTTPIVQPSPTPKPSKTPEVQPEPKLPVTETAAVAAISNLVDIAPADLTDKQVAALVEAANVVFQTADQGSPAYEQALQALAVAAQADDPQLPAEFASVPGAAAVLATFNALGNVGADMAPAVREESKKTVIASVIAAGAAVNATVMASISTTPTPSPTSSGSTGGSTGGSSGGSSGGSEAKTESNTSRSSRKETK